MNTIDRAALFFHRAYCALVMFLHNAGAPDWLVNLPSYLVPHVLKLAGAKAWLKARSLADSGHPLRG